MREPDLDAIDKAVAGALQNRQIIMVRGIADELVDERQGHCGERNELVVV